MSRQGIDNMIDKQAHRISYPMSKRLYTLKEAAIYLGRPVFSLRTLIWNGKLPVIQDGRKYYIDIYDLDEFIQSEKKRIL